MSTDLLTTARTHGARHMTDATTITPTPEWTTAVRDRCWRGIDRLADRHRQAIALHEHGHTYEDIAARLGFGNRNSAYYAVHYSATAQEMRSNRAVVAQDSPNAPKMTCDTTPDAQAARTGDFSDAGREAA